MAMRFLRHPSFLVASLLAVFVPVATPFILSLGFLTFGLAHACFDSEHAKRKGQTALALIARYGCSSLFVFALFCLETKLAFLLFLILSAYHFGGEARDDENATGPQDLMALVRGLAIFALLILSHGATVEFEIWRWVGVDSHIHAISRGWTVISLAFSAAVLILSACADASANARRSKSDGLSKTAQFSIIIEELILAVVLMLFPLWISAGLFFVFWHSLDAFEAEREELELTRKQALIQILPYTLPVASAVILIGFYILTQNSDPTLMKVSVWAACSLAAAHAIEQIFRPGRRSLQLPSALLRSSEG